MNEYNFIFIHIMTRTTINPNKQSALMTAAHDVFVANGYKKTNIADITTKAGMAVGSFYNYFESKEDIFLRVFVEENTRVRQRVVEVIDWQAPAEQLVNDLFSMMLGATRRNNILTEWTNPEIGLRLQQYYRSETGKTDNSFHQFILKVFRERLADMGYDVAEIVRIIKVYELLYAIDCQPAVNRLPDHEENMQTLLRYFLKGVAIEDTNDAEK